jgi:hypothetical protein
MAAFWEEQGAEAASPQFSKWVVSVGLRDIMAEVRLADPHVALQHQFWLISGGEELIIAGAQESIP